MTKTVAFGRKHSAPTVNVFLGLTAIDKFHSYGKCYRRCAESVI